MSVVLLRQTIYNDECFQITFSMSFHFISCTDLFLGKTHFCAALPPAAAFAHDWSKVGDLTTVKSVGQLRADNLLVYEGLAGSGGNKGGRAGSHRSNQRQKPQHQSEREDGTPKLT